MYFSDKTRNRVKVTPLIIKKKKGRHFHEGEKIISCIENLRITTFLSEKMIVFLRNEARKKIGNIFV